MKVWFWLKWFFSLILSIVKYGINLYSILDAQTRLQKSKIAFIIDHQNIQFVDLKQRTDQLIYEWLKPEFKQKLPQQIGLMMHQDLDSLATLFALSRLSKDVVIVNPNLVLHKLQSIIKQKQLFLIGNEDDFNRLDTQKFLIIPSPLTDQNLTIKFPTLIKLKPSFFNKISVCSSGSTGIPKIATRKSKPLQSLHLLDLMLRKLNFLHIKQVFVMTPICHAAGLTASLMAFSFSKTVILQQRFDAEKAQQLIEQHQIDCLNLVPTILYRLIERKALLKSVRYIITGSAPLSVQLVKDVIAHHPQLQLFNLYGSSETGINLFATPENLRLHPTSIGKAIQSVKIKITDAQGHILQQNQVGILWTKCAWSITPNQWIQCGDLALQDSEGFYYLKGRQDNMLICGGVNVYPIDLENIVYQHPAIQYVQAYAVQDEELGQCLAVDIIPTETIDLNDLQHWIAAQTPRYLRPKHIHIIQQIETDSIGKPILKL